MYQYCDLQKTILGIVFHICVTKDFSGKKLENYKEDFVYRFLRFVPHNKYILVP